MRASHVAACLVGTVVCFVLFVTSRITTNALGADAFDKYASLIVYTPHVRPGDSLRARVRTSSGEASEIREIAARIDDGEKFELFRHPTHTPGSNIMDFVIPIDRALPPGDHTLAVSVETPYESELHTTIHVATSTMQGRLLSLLRAIGAALAVFLLVRALYRRTRAWVGDFEGKAASMLVSPALAVLVLWFAAGYPLFARPLAAAVGTPDFVIVLAMLFWTALPIVLLRRQARAPTPLS